MSPDPAPDAVTLAARFAQRLTERDAPPPPPSPEPAAVLARIQAWLLPPEGVRDARTHLRMARMLVALMEHPELSTYQLQVAAGLSWRAGACRWSYSRGALRCGSGAAGTSTTASPARPRMRCW